MNEYISWGGDYDTTETVHVSDDHTDTTTQTSTEEISGSVDEHDKVQADENQESDGESLEEKVCTHFF